MPAFAWKPLLSDCRLPRSCSASSSAAPAWSIALPLFVIMTRVCQRASFAGAPTLALAAGATVFCALVFVKGLGVPLPLIGRWFGG